MPKMILPPIKPPRSGYCYICTMWVPGPVPGPSGKMVCRLDKIASGKFHSCGDWQWNGKY